MAWSYEEAYVGLTPNYRRLCPFCGSPSVQFTKDWGGQYVFRCFNEGCGATVHFETREPHSWTKPRGAAASVHCWNRRAADAE